MKIEFWVSSTTGLNFRVLYSSSEDLPDHPLSSLNYKSPNPNGPAAPSPDVRGWQSEK